VSKVLSTVPCHVLAAGGHVPLPSAFHKTKGNAVETRWLASSAGDFALNLPRRLWRGFCVCFEKQK